VRLGGAGRHHLLTRLECPAEVTSQFSYPQWWSTLHHWGKLYWGICRFLGVSLKLPTSDGRGSRWQPFENSRNTCTHFSDPSLSLKALGYKKSHLNSRVSKSRNYDAVVIAPLTRLTRLTPLTRLNPDCHSDSPDSRNTPLTRLTAACPSDSPCAS
jgi:hypothetical protein